MRIFLDFEASSLNKAGYPIEVGWVFEDGWEESHLIRPASDWTDWDPDAARIHGISQQTLEAQGEPAEAVAKRMMELFEGEELIAGAPSWDGKWLSMLLRAGGFPRHALRLKASHDARLEAAMATLGGVADEAQRASLAELAVKRAEEAMAAKPSEHRALADAKRERDTWVLAGSIAAELADTSEDE